MKRHLDKMAGEAKGPGRPKLGEDRKKLVIMLPPDLWESVQREAADRRIAGEKVEVDGKARLIDLGDVVSEALRTRYKKR